MGTKLDPATEKITLVEFDIGQAQALFFNWTAGVWYVDFDAVYERIDPIYLAGISAQPSISKVGSVMEDGVQLTFVATVALCITTDASFYYDLLDRRLYVHLGGGDEPSIHTVIIGVTTGVSNRACNYNSMYYEPRLRSAPVIAKSKDPLFFGRISFEGGTFGVENADGGYDSLATAGGALWGGAVRVLQGFDDDAYASFLKMAAGQVKNVRVEQTLASIDMIDKRAFLSRMAPRRTFTIGTYPNIHYSNLGKFIPLLYGDCKKVPVVCTNEDAVAPASYSFKICDCTDHPIESIDHVYVDDAEKTPASTDLANGTFTLALADYSPGQEVTASAHGYTSGGVLIANAADVIADLLATYCGLTFIATYFNLAEWATAEAAAMDVGDFIDEPVEVFQIVEDVCASALLNFIQQDDGVFTLRAYDPARAVSDTYAADQLMGTPTVLVDTSQVLSSTDVGYDRDWAAGSFQRLHDTSQEAAVYAVYKTYRERKFDTLLTSAADAQAFSTAVLAVAGKVQTLVAATFKLQPVGRELMDFVMLPVYRQGGASMLGMVKAEIYSISKDLLAATVELGCRVV